MSVQEFLAGQKDGFVLLRDLLAEIRMVNHCNLKDAAQALSICLHQARDGGPKWHTFGDTTGAIEMTDLKSTGDASSLLRALAEDASGRFSNPPDGLPAFHLNEFPAEDRVGFLMAYMRAGFLRRDIYPLLAASPNKLLPAATDDFVPPLSIGNNRREKVVAWVAWRARVLVAAGDKTESLAAKIVDEVPPGVLSAKSPITVASVVRMLPKGITGGRAKNGRKSAER